jgi:hypothetical protein
MCKKHIVQSINNNGIIIHKCFVCKEFLGTVQKVKVIKPKVAV